MIDREGHLRGANREGRPTKASRLPQRAISLLLIALSSCAVGPDYTRPAIEGPDRFTGELERGLKAGAASLGEWWTVFGDSTLNSLIERSLKNNLDLKQALHRIQEARALRGIVRTDLFPRVDATGSFSRAQTSEEGALGAPSPRVSNQFSVGFDASWELDIWGRNRRGVEAAQGEIEASLEGARAIQVTVLAETALNYVELRNLQERIRIARANVELQRKTVELTKNQFDANLVSQLDVAQAQANFASTRSTLPSLEAASRATRNRLAVLLGVFPGELEEELSKSAPLPRPPAEVTVGIPVDLIRRRPDIRQAERLLAAQTARIGIATADLYPRLSLSGTIGFDAEDAGDLFSGSSRAFRFGPSILWNAFDRSRIHNKIDVESERMEQALLSYEQSVLLALEEAENAMVRFVRGQASRDDLQTAVAETRRAVELSNDRYRQGLVSFQSVLDTQSRLFSLEDALAATQANITSDLISLYKALGGGWESRSIVLGAAHKQEASK